MKMNLQLSYFINNISRRKRTVMIINEGGINGSGEGLVNTNSKEFKYLQRMIKEASMAQSEQQKTENRFLSIRFQMEAYLREETEVIIPAGKSKSEFNNKSTS